jgi:cob(I)alamin adenosyltransferase
MGSIATTRGDAGETGLAGGIRVSKASVRVDAYGNIDELISTLGFARSLCADDTTVEVVRAVQRELFKIGSSLATPPESAKPQVPIDVAMVERLTSEVHRLEAIDGMLSDWSVSGADTTAAAFDMARTVCRRAERGVVRLVEAGEPVQPNIVPYLNRLSDLLWLFARKLELDAGVSGSLRLETGRTGNRWSRAW